MPKFKVFIFDDRDDCFRLRQSRTSLVGSEEGEDITSDAMSLGKD